MSLIPCLTCKDSARVQLNSIRYAFTVLSNLAIFVSCFFLITAEEVLTGSSNGPGANVTNIEFNSTLIGFNESSSIGYNESSTVECETQTQIKWEDRSIFMYMAFGSIGLGLFFAAVFHFLVEEKPDCEPCDSRQGDDELEGTGVNGLVRRTVY